MIPARGGSKRIPGKNIRPFGGVPIIARSIRAAIDSGLFEKVIVSTDDDEIARVAVEHSADVPFSRPAELADDFSGILDVMAHAVAWMQGEGWAPTSVCCIYATAPLIDGGDLQRGASEIETGRWDYAFGATDFASPIFRAFSAHEDGGVEMFFPDEFETRSQDLPVALHDAGQFCWGLPHAWLERRRVFTRRSYPILIPRWRVQDIDTPDDWVRAELILRVLTAEGES